MDSPDKRTVLVVTDDESVVDRMETALAERKRDVSVAALDDFGALFDVLCYETVNCLVLPATVDETSANDVALAVTGLYPDLPIVIAGEPSGSGPDDRTGTVVDADDLTDDDVIDAVAESVVDHGESDAARPPSRLETLVMSMFDQFPAHLYAKDADGRHLLVSRHNWEPTDLVGMTDLEYTQLPKEHREAAYRDDMAVLDNEEPRLEIEEYTNFIDMYTLTSKVPWYDADGNVVGLVGHTQDISERKQREHASRRQQELLVKVALVAAHELRNELQVAMGRLQLADMDHDDYEKIQQSLAKLSSIADRVIALASAERSEGRLEPIWLSTMSREVWDTIDVSGGTLNLTEDGLFEADPEATSLLMQLLVSNAVRHGGDDVTVTIGALEDGFYVADDGDGIEADPPERVFDAGYTTDDEGTGFGLYVAHSVASEQDWEVTISESGEGGARFEVTGLVREE